MIFFYKQLICFSYKKNKKIKIIIGLIELMQKVSVKLKPNAFLLSKTALKTKNKNNNYINF